MPLIPFAILAVIVSGAFVASEAVEDAIQQAPASNPGVGLNLQTAGVLLLGASAALYLKGR